MGGIREVLRGLFLREEILGSRRLVGDFDGLRGMFLKSRISCPPVVSLVRERIWLLWVEMHLTGISMTMKM